MSPRIGFLLGRSPGTGSVLPAAVERLERAGASVTVQVFDGGTPIEPSLFRADLVVLRALETRGMDAAEQLVSHGVRCCNSLAATRATRDKAVTVRALQAAGIPMPESAVATDWSGVRAMVGGRPVVVKAVRGSRGIGVLLVEGGGLPMEAPFDGPYLVQERVTGGGSDRKVYVIGDRIAGVLRTWPPQDLEAKLGRAFVPSDGEVGAARAVGTALGLEIFGLDLLRTERGFVVVDVNSFPGFKGVPGAGRWLADHLLAAARSEVSRCAS